LRRKGGCLSDPLHLSQKWSGFATKLGPSSVQVLCVQQAEIASVRKFPFLEVNPIRCVSLIMLRGLTKPSPPKVIGFGPKQSLTQLLFSYD